MSFLSTHLADSPIRGYRLDDSPKTNGSSVADSGSQAQNGTVSGTGLSSASSLLTSDSDGATTFATSSYITLPTTGLPTGASAWSVEAWINMPTLPGAAFSTVLHFGTASGTNQSLQIYYRASPSRFDVWGWSALIVNSTGVTPTAGATYQLVVTYDGSSVVTLYINGVSNASASGVTMALVEAAAQIGNDTAGDYMAGVIDEVWFYPSTLNSTQVAALYASSTAVSLSATIAGVGTLSETLTLKTALSTTIPGAGTLAGTLTLKTALAATIAGVGIVSATLSLSGVALSATIRGVGTLSGTLTLPHLTYSNYKLTIEPQLVAALNAKNLLNYVQLIGPDTTMANDSWLTSASADLNSTLSGYVRHAFPTGASDISNDSREVAVKALISGIYANDPTAKPVIQGEMGFGAQGPGQSVTLYQYGVEMADFAVQLARAGMATLIAYILDDDMHGVQWGMWQISDSSSTPRPWAWIWAVLSNTLVPGSQLYASAQPTSNDFRFLAAQTPQGAWTFVLVNRKALAQNIQIIVPFAPVASTSMQSYVYSNTTPLLLDGNGFALSSGAVTGVLSRGFTVPIAANSVLVLSQATAPQNTIYDVKRPPLQRRR